MTVIKAHNPISYQLESTVSVGGIGAGGGERIDIEKMCLEALKSTIAPDGFAYDKSTGLYYGEASKMHWHCKANVYKTEDGNWWKYNGQMFEAASEP